MASKWFAALFGSMAACGLVLAWAQGASPMTPEETMRAAALAAGEVPGFSAQGSIVEHKDTKWGVKDTRLLQTLKREGTGVNGRKPTFIRIWAFLLPGADMAYELATEYAGTTPIVRGKPRLHSHWLAEGSWSGLPIGEKSWESAPRTGGVSLSASLVVWDGPLAFRIKMEQPPTDATARNLRFQPIAEEDLALAEYAARLLLSRVQ